jgi:hypothetical protein
MCQEAQHAHAIIERHEYDALPCHGLTVNPTAGAASRGKSSTINPDDDRLFRRRVPLCGPDIQEKTVFATYPLVLLYRIGAKGHAAPDPCPGRNGLGLPPPQRPYGRGRKRDALEYPDVSSGIGCA